MKIKILFLFVLVVLLVSACAATVAPLMQLPDEGRQLVSILLSAAIVWLLLQISALVGWDLSGYAPPIIAAVSPLIITIIERYLQMIPSIYDDFVLVVIHYLVLLLGSVGTVIAVKRIKRKEVKQLLM